MTLPARWGAKRVLEAAGDCKSPTALGRDESYLASYILVIVKLPLPVQPIPPVNVHVPVIVPPFTVPDKASVLPAGFPELMLKSNLPETFPLKSPIRTKDPLSVSPETKHDEFVVKLKLVMLSVPPLFTTSEVPKPKTGFPFVSVRLAVQFPLIFPAVVITARPTAGKNHSGRYEHRQCKPVHT